MTRVAEILDLEFSDYSSMVDLGATAAPGRSAWPGATRNLKATDPRPPGLPAARRGVHPVDQARGPGPFQAGNPDEAEPGRRVRPGAPAAPPVAAEPRPSRDPRSARNSLRAGGRPDRHRVPARGREGRAARGGALPPQRGRDLRPRTPAGPHARRAVPPPERRRVLERRHGGPADVRDHGDHRDEG